jgi:hypothetical protein
MTNWIPSTLLLVVASACSSSHGSADGGIADGRTSDGGCESSQPAVHLYEAMCPAGSMGTTGCLIDHMPMGFF